MAVTKAGPADQPFSGAFRWTLQEDRTFDIVPGVTGVGDGTPRSGLIPAGEFGAGTPNTTSLNMHRSYMPVIATGTATGGTFDLGSVAGLVSGRRYYLSVLPNGGTDGTPVYAMGATSVRAGGPAVNLFLNVGPIPTAQISVLAFEDNNPINNQPDDPGVAHVATNANPAAVEKGLCGFEVLLVDAGGTYGASGGRITADAFGNPLGTTYRDNGDVDKLGSSILLTGLDGSLQIKNLVPAKYTIFVFPPAAQPTNAQCPGVYGDRNGQVQWGPVWSQTATIEGTWGVDAWVKADEPKHYREFGPPSHHVQIGLVKPFKDTSRNGGLNGPVTLTGRVRNIHMTRVPEFGFYNGEPVAECWIGLNAGASGGEGGAGLYAGACNADGTFSISGLRSATRYQLVAWDTPLDQVVGSFDFTTPTSGNTQSLGDVPVFRWFGKLEGHTFFDINKNGYRDTGEPGIPGQAVNIRFRDGSIYQSANTDAEGKYELTEVFPFFNWLIAETDFGRFRQIGRTAVVDAGGAIPGNAEPKQNSTALDIALARGADRDDVEGFKKLTPQRQVLADGTTANPLCHNLDGTSPAPANNQLSCTTLDDGLDTLLAGMQLFLGSTNTIDWAKSNYDATVQNGGITGIVHYASTRAEWDPRFATAENNEPGIPGVLIRLFKAWPGGTVGNAVVPSNPRLIQAASGALRDPTGVLAPRPARADAVNEYVTDSWDESPISNCVGTGFTTREGIKTDCFDGLRNYNQVNGGVFDGGYAFLSHFPGGLQTDGTPVGPEVPGLPNGNYIVQSLLPSAYQHQKEEDKNVDFGDTMTVSTQALPAECVGDRGFEETLDGLSARAHPSLDIARDGSGVQTGPSLSLFDGVIIPAQFTRSPGGAHRPLCNFKTVAVRQASNAAADFHAFTEAPIAGQIKGLILDDLSNEFNAFSPNFSEKYAPPFLPVSLRDWTGREVNRVYSDRYGNYNGLVPSTFWYNVPMPSGVSPNLITACLNSPWMQDPANPDQRILDPNYNPQYAQFCWTLQYLPGKTTYADTPIFPISAFSGPQQYALDCRQPNGVPQIKQVDVANGVGGPWKLAGNTSAEVTITALGDANADVDVLNPLYNQEEPGILVNGQPVPKNIKRNAGFGATQGSGKVVLNGQSLDIVSWANKTIVATIPAASTGGQLTVVKGDGTETPSGVTVHVVAAAPRQVDPGQSIQAAVDAAAAGELIVVKPGVYEQYVILNKRLRLQGYGAGATILNPVSNPSEKLVAWRQRACEIVIDSPNVLLAGQTLPAAGPNRAARIAACVTGDTAGATPTLFASEEGPGVFVLLPPPNNLLAPNDNANSLTKALQIDGFTISGNDQTAIIANGNATELKITNNVVFGNQGQYTGGVRIGHTDLPGGNNATGGITDGNNNRVQIAYNEIRNNGNLAGEAGGGGGGISLFTGATGFKVSNNFVCGNFSTSNGGGMLVEGRMLPGTVGNAVTTGTIENNKFLFNQSFFQANAVHGGGLAIVGPVDPNATNGISIGTGNVDIVRNLFQGNAAGAGDGGGIFLQGINGSDSTVAAVTDDNPQGINGSRVRILNNVVVNNMAGNAGGGIALVDAPNVLLANNTVAHNDSTATAVGAFALGAAPNGVRAQTSRSTAQPGVGIAIRPHSAGLAARLTNHTNPALRMYSAATIANTLLQGNRSFYWSVTNSSVSQPTATQANCLTDGALGGGAQPGVANCYGLVPADGAAFYTDVQVLAPTNTTITTYLNGLAGLNTLSLGGNTAPFASSYFNGSRDATAVLTPTNAGGQVWVSPERSIASPSTAAAFDEGGNFIDARFGPLTLRSPVPGAGFDALYGDYALKSNPGAGQVLSSSAFTNGGYLSKDFLGQLRGATWTVGAYQYVAP